MNQAHKASNDQGSPGAGAGGNGAPKAAAAERTVPQRLIFRPLPDTIYLWPTLVAAFLSGLIAAFNPDSRVASWLFMVPFFANMLVITFEFNRVRVVVLGLLVVTVLTLLFYWDSQRGDVFKEIGQGVSSLRMHANAGFYFGVGFILLFIFIFIYISSRFNYWEISGNELIHHHGVLGNVERYPAVNMKINKEIIDVFQWLTCGAGILVFTPAGEQRSIHLRNVLRINKVEAEIKEMLSTYSVSLFDTKGKDWM